MRSNDSVPGSVMEWLVNAPSRRRLSAGLILVLALAGPGSTGILHAAVAPAQGSAVADPHVLKFRANMPANALVGRPDTDFVELSNGRRLRVGDLRRLTASVERMRTAPIRPLPLALTARPATTGKPVKNAADLAAALKLPDTDTIVLPSGQRLTVAMLRLLQPQVEKRLGRSLTAGRIGP